MKKEQEPTIKDMNKKLDLVVSSVLGLKETVEDLQDTVEGLARSTANSFVDMEHKIEERFTRHETIQKMLVSQVSDFSDELKQMGTRVKMQYAVSGIQERAGKKLQQEMQFLKFKVQRLENKK